MEYVKVTAIMITNNTGVASRSLAAGGKLIPSLVRSALRYFRLAVIAVALAFLIKLLLIEAYNIPSESMANTLLVGDFLIADKLTYGPRLPIVGIKLPALRDPKTGDVVVFRFPDNPSKNFIKRIVAKGGDEVQILDKAVYVNGKVVDESRYAIHSDSQIIPAGSSQPRDNFGPITVPFGHYFVLGDNRDNSSDSRFWGTVPRDNISGKAILIHWSWRPDNNAPAITWWNPISVLSATAYHIYHLPERVRWDRLFHYIS